MRFSVLLASLVLGCGGSHGTTDAPGDGVTIKVDTQGTTFDLVAYNDAGAWQMATPSGSGFDLLVHGPYVLAAVCGTPTYYARTPSDPQTIMISCEKQPPTMFNVTGQMVQAGEVGVGPDVDESADPNWSFTVPVTAGTYNVAALSTDRVEIRRDVAVSGALALTPAFDVATNGVALVATPFTIVNTTPQENHNASVTLRSTHGDMTVFNGPTARVKVLPPDVMTNGEVLSVALSAASATASRTLRRDWHPGDSTSFTLPPALDKVQYTASNGNLVAMLPELPAAFDLATLSVRSSGSTLMQFTRAYVDAVHMLTFDQSVPGFQDAWKLDFSKPYTATLEVQRTDGADQLTQTTSAVPGVP